MNGEINFIILNTCECSYTHTSALNNRYSSANPETMRHGVNMRGKTLGYDVTAKYAESATLSQHDYKRKIKPDFTRAFKASFAEGG